MIMHDKNSRIVLYNDPGKKKSLFFVYIGFHKACVNTTHDTSCQK